MAEDMKEQTNGQAQPGVMQTADSKQADAPPDGPKMSPEVQEQYDMFVMNGMQIIHSDKVMNSMFTQIQKAENPIQGIADFTVGIVNKLVDSAKASGNQIAPSVLVHGGNVLMGEVMNLTEAAGMTPLNEAQRTQAWQLASSQFIDGSVKGGRMSKEELAKLGKETSQTEQGQEVIQTAKKAQAGPAGPTQSGPGSNQAPAGIMQGGA